MRTKYDVVIQSERLDDSLVEVRVTVLPTPRIKEGYQRTIDVDVSHVARTTDTATEEQIQGAAEAFALHWLIVVGGIIPHEFRDDGSKPLSGKFFELQFQHVESLLEGIEIAAQDIAESAYFDGDSPTGIAGALLYGRFNRAKILPITPEKAALADSYAESSKHFADSRVFYRNRVEETLQDTQWGRITVPYRAYGKAYMIHVRSLQGMKRDDFTIPSAYQWCYLLLSQREWQPEKNPDYSFLKLPYDKEHVKKVELWSLANPRNLVEHGWVATITTEEINGRLIRYCSDLNRIDRNDVARKAQAIAASSGY